MRLIEWIFIAASITFASAQLETVYEWKSIDYFWNTPEEKQSYIDNGDYDPTKIIPIDVDRSKDGRVFVTTIKDKGVPATLSTISERSGESGPLLRPYPDWSWHNEGDCDNITNVYRVAIDECNRLFVLDNGFIGADPVCPAQLLIFNLNTDTLIHRIRIPDWISKNKNGRGKLVTPVIQANGSNCKLENVFMADPHGRGLVIWREQRLFRLNAKVFEPDSSKTTVEIAGESFGLEDSLMGMALTPEIFKGEESELVFRPFSSHNLYTASVRVLERSTYGNTIRYRNYIDFLPSQATTMAVSSQGTLFYGLTKEVAIGCWNKYRPASEAAIAVQDKDRLQFLSGLKVLPATRTNGKEEIWALSNRFQKIRLGTINYNEVNFRIVKSTVDTLINGTLCEQPEQVDPQSIIRFNV